MTFPARRPTTQELTQRRDHAAQHHHPGEPRRRRHAGASTCIAGWLPDLAAATSTRTSYNWSYTTPFNLQPGQYSLHRAGHGRRGTQHVVDQPGALTINVQVAGDAPPNGLLSTDRHLTGAAGRCTSTWPARRPTTAGVAAVEVDPAGERHGPVSASRTDACPRRSRRSRRPSRSPGATSTTWTLSVDLPTAGDWSVTAYAFDTAGQQDTSTTRGDRPLPRSTRATRPPTVT